MTIKDASSTQLLVTKLYMPPVRDSLVERPELLRQLDSAYDVRLTLVTAPAGYGKTTLVTSWLAQKNRPLAWISLDEQDNIPLQFLSYLVGALERIEPGVCCTARPLLASQNPPAGKFILTCLINDLAALDETFLLILDDYHVIYNTEVQAALAFLIENAAPNLHTIILSRRAPELPLAKIRATDQLLEITQFDLRFNLEETADFLNQVMALDIQPKEISELDKQTEGWVTGLQLAAIGMRNHEDVAQFVNDLSGDDRLIADYLIDEVLSLQPPDIQRFLIQTSLLRQFNAPLCNRLLAIDNSQEILQQLEQSNLFIVPLDNTREWYRYHHLFAELLRSRLEIGRPDLIPRLYQRAIDWHLENGPAERAITYAIAGQDFDRAAAIIKAELHRLETSGKRDLLINWLAQIPLAIMRKNTALWMSYITSHFYYSRFNEARDILQALWHDPDVTHELSETEIILARGHEAVLLAAIVRHTTLDASRVCAITEQALSLLPEDAYLSRGIAYGHHGSAQLMLGNMNQARQSLERSIRILERVGWSGLMVFRNYYAHFLLSAGLIGQAQLLLKDIYQNAHSRNIQKGNTFSDTLIGYGVIEYEWNNLRKAAEYIEEGVKLAESSVSADRLVQAYEAMFRVAPALGNLDEMRSKLRRLDGVAAQYSFPPYFQDRLQALWARLALAEGDLFEARRWCHYFEWSHQKKITALQHFEWHTVALVYLADQDYAKSIHLLRQFQAQSRQQVRTQDEIITGVDLARALFDGGFEQQAKEEVAVLLGLAQPEGYVRTFVDGGPVVRGLLERLRYEYGQDKPVKEPSPAKQIAYITHILAAFGPAAEIQPVEAVTSATVIVESLLTPREKEVVAHLAQGMTYADIASQLVITENTLKYHIKHIYSKLQVRNRTEAVLKAQKLQLI